jgi:hypothetical protein
MRTRQNYKSFVHLFTYSLESLNLNITIQLQNTKQSRHTWLHESSVKFLHRSTAFVQSNESEKGGDDIPKNGDPFLLVDSASGEHRVPWHLRTRNLPGRRKCDKRHLELLLLLLPGRRRWGLLLMHDPVHRGTLPGLILPRGGPPRRGGGGSVGAKRGGEEAAASGRGRRGPGCLRRGVGRRGRGVSGEVVQGEQRGRRRRGGGLRLAAHWRRRHAEGRGHRRG